MLKEFMDDVIKHYTLRIFFKGLFIGIGALILILALLACKGPVEFYPIQDSWVNPFSDKDIPLKDVCGACGVDHQLLVAAGVDLSRC
jgi:hypothetical protein